ncbi:MAG: hypothetical protein IMZ66_05215, partial [Planctomycetes bacterium]|nr:hypothetical protein [Planctomycetota bacterium]
FEAYFNTPLSPQHYASLPTALQEHADYLASLGRRLAFIEQDRQAGLGHAVLCAEGWVAGEPFLLMLGDHVFRSDVEAPCAAQIMAAYEAAGTSVMGLAVTPPEEVSNFGTVGGTWTEDGALLVIAEFAEKPSLDYAEARLHIEGVADGFLSFFGLYALNASVFDHLRHLRDAALRRGEELQLTDALSLLRHDEPCFGCVVRGRRFDTGRPEQYLKTLAAFAAPPPAPKRARRPKKTPRPNPAPGDGPPPTGTAPPAPGDTPRPPAGKP